eukprot:76297-Chlamydomonas_euryale.AAC.2
MYISCKVRLGQRQSAAPLSVSLTRPASHRQAHAPARQRPAHVNTHETASAFFGSGAAHCCSRRRRWQRCSTLGARAGRSQQSCLGARAATMLTRYAR